MDELIKFLEENDVEITDDLKKEIKNIWNSNLPDEDDLFTQDDVDEIVKKRLAREEKLHEREIKGLEEKMEDMIPPEKVEEYKKAKKEAEEELEKYKTSQKIDYELQLSAKDAGVKDQEYFEFLVEKKGLKDRLITDDDGKVVATDKEGNILTEDGEKLGPSALINEMKEEKPDIFGEEKEDGKDIGGGGNPGGSGPKDKKKNTESLAMELGYKSKKESE
ncbi:hypothetical protein SAMN04515654_12127 [Halanaerobium congolense]|uniref:Phage minor structural protein GP20 n=1 Tax=Halanaerobium congolense TaxID=54121 RepID=A0A1G8PU92_9FIRM|nr:hypothetical protein [Halanaerobium congolense]SDI95918.1 hypothetical protein SAMN04515654_12127 [Halanaerobium congolense]SES90655.1 hypothetical protein SAMN04515653_10427 [Halanaerobium congolense]